MPFAKGNQLAKNRVSSKNLLPLIRERVLKATNKRITADNMLSKVSDVDLLKFAQSIMPKDINVDINKTHVVYISNTPRPAACIDATVVKPDEAPALPDNTQATKNSTPIDNTIACVADNITTSDVDNDQ